MDLPRIYEHLEGLLTKLGVVVRSERFDARLFGDLGGRGGLCTLRGQQVVVVDARAPLADRVGVLACALTQFDLSGIYLPPQVRDLVDAHAAEPQATRPEGVKKARLRLVRDDDEEPSG